MTKCPIQPDLIPEFVLPVSICDHQSSFLPQYRCADGKHTESVIATSAGGYSASCACVHPSVVRVATIFTSRPRCCVVEDWMQASRPSCRHGLFSFCGPLFLVSFVTRILSVRIQIAEACAPNCSAGETELRATQTSDFRLEKSLW